MNRLGADIKEAKILSETESLSDSGLADNSGIQWIARQADKLSAGNRGSWVTEALIIAEYAKNDSDLRSAYQNGDADIDRYFENVDVQKIINDVGPGVQKRIKTGVADLVRNNVPGFLMGSIAAASFIIAMKKYKS